MAVKGIIYSLITLLFLTSLMQFNVAVQEINLNSNKYIAQFNNTESMFLTIKENIIDMRKSPLAKEYVERLVPFEYDYNSSLKKVYYETVFPLRSSRISNFYDILNMYAIFLSSSGDNLDINASAPRNSVYGGSDLARFLISSPCMRYTIFDTDSLSFAPTNSPLCDFNFSSSKIDKIYIDVNVKKLDSDFNQIICNPSCYSDSYSSPYYVIRLNKDSCSSCGFSDTIVSKVVSSGTNFSVKLCNGDCSNMVEVVVDGYDLNFSRTGSSPTSLSISAYYTEDFGDLLIEDFLVSVDSKSLNMRKTNNLLDYYAD